MPSIKAVRAANAKISFSYVPTAVFVGGTSGIGRGVVQAFAKYTKGNANIVIVGRNADAAQSIISRFPPPPSPEVKHEFIQSDVSLMSNIHTTTSELLSRYPKINFLVLTPGILSLSGRQETSEGIDKKLAVHHYARFAFTHRLLPALKNAADSNEDAKVLSVFAAGTGTKVDLNDLGLKKDYTVSRAAGQSASYHDVAFKEFTVRNPSDKLTFTYSYPGMVDTGGFKSTSNAITRGLNSLAVLTTKPFSISLEDAGEYQLYGMLQHTGGFQRFGSTGDHLGNKNFFGEDEEVRKKVWEHTVEECRITE